MRAQFGLLLSIVLLCTAFATSAQERDRDRVRDPVADPDRTPQRERAADQDRIADRDRTADRAQDRDQDRDQDRTQDRDQDRDRDRLQLHVQDREQFLLRDIYGSQLMTRQERRQYRREIRDMENAQEWARYRAQHQERMMARAREQGTELPPPYYGQQLMTDRERLQLRERLENAASEQERERIRNEHRERMQERARANDIPLSELEADGRP